MGSIDFFFIGEEKNILSQISMKRGREGGERGLETLTFRDRSEQFCLNNSSANVYSRTVVAWYDYVDVTSITCSKEYITRYIRLPLFSYSPLCWIRIFTWFPLINQFETRRIAIFVREIWNMKRENMNEFFILAWNGTRDRDCYRLILILDDTLIISLWWM